VSRQQTFERLVHDLYGLAARDELTGVFNRRFALSEAEKLLDEGHALTLVLFDLDDFKRVNDTWGHLAGDRILRDIGALFQRRTRPEDLVGRYGGDEFVMVLNGLPLDEVEAIAARLVSDICALHWTMDVEECSVGATMGIGSSELLPNPSLSQVFDAADRDLYKNKWIKKHPNEVRPVEEPREDRPLPLPRAIDERRA
jgi:diguanylate cyclase (GGDEF)-like protein